MAQVRSEPPAELLTEPVIEVTDLLPSTDAIRLRTSRMRVVIRPSGTEPKLKCYLQVVTAVPEGADLAEMRLTAAGEMSRLTTEIAAAVGLHGLDSGQG